MLTQPHLCVCKFGSHPCAVCRLVPCVAAVPAGALGHLYTLKISYREHIQKIVSNFTSLPAPKC